MSHEESSSSEESSYDSASSSSEDDSYDELDLSSSLNESARIPSLRQRGRPLEGSASSLYTTNQQQQQYHKPRIRQRGAQSSRRRSRQRLCCEDLKDVSLICSAMGTVLLCFSFTLYVVLSFFPSLTEYIVVVENSFSDEVKVLPRPLKRRPTQTKKKKKNSEALAEGCVRPAWQMRNFQSCNTLHEVDLRQGKFLDHGLWRDVMSIEDALQQKLVLKLMKAEHKVETRNFDRHRRDALVMERFTASPYIVDIYGFCGNNMLTEFIPANLEQVILENNENVTQQLQMALDGSRALKAIHSMDIVHADLQAKQFLVQNGRVKLNDFNRCRFMAYRNETTACPFHIPTSPGKFRSPEEYRNDNLDTSLDIYSMGHVLFGIATGILEPWGRYGAQQTKQFVLEGRQPIMPDTTHNGLARLIRQAYTLNVTKRITASELAEALELELTVNK